MKEETEKQNEQDEDEMMYTYAVDNERKVKYSYTYACAQNSLVANELARHEKSSAAAAAAAAANQPLLSTTPILANTPPPPSTPPTPPVRNSIPSISLVKPINRIQSNSTQPVTVKRQSSVPNDNIRRRRLQNVSPVIPSPPPPSISANSSTPTSSASIPVSISLPSVNTQPPALIQKPGMTTASSKTGSQLSIPTSSRAIRIRRNSNDDCGDSSTLLVADDFDDDDELEGDHRIYSAKSKTTISTVTRKPISNITRVNPSPGIVRSATTATTNGQQQIWIVNSLDQQSVLSLINYINPNSNNNSRPTGSIVLSQKSNANSSPVTNLITHTPPRSSSTSGTVYQIRSPATPLQQTQTLQATIQQQAPQQSTQAQPSVIYQFQNGRLFQSTKKTS